MSYADRLFVDMCSDIIENGISTEGEKVRPKWEDGSYAYTIKKFGVCSRYDLSMEFPALTLRKTYIKSAFEELCWIWQRKDNNINNLRSGVWDEWADAQGSIGKAYGYQLARRFRWRDVSEQGLSAAFPGGRLMEDNGVKSYVDANGRTAAIYVQDDKPHWLMDQVDKVIYDLVNTPFSRRIMTNMYAFEDLMEMNLYPCAYSVTFNVTTDSEGGFVLNAVLNQRSQDILAANNWNVCQYALLVMMLSQVCGMKPGILMHVIADAHIYDRHIDIIKELIGREQYPAPTVRLNPGVRDFYAFTGEDLIIEDYRAGEQVKNIPIAV